MGSIFIPAVFGILLLLSGVSSAETGAECQARCSAEKTSKDESCPTAEDTSERTGALCLQESQDAFNSCLKDCPQPEPAGTTEEK